MGVKEWFKLDGRVALVSEASRHITGQYLAVPRFGHFMHCRWCDVRWSN